ncbi:hypothetical protein PBF_04260 [Cytobacillus firmus DS1]|uniref:Uncharacterized protein n=1 Tax=Cytobacillus firmus DS1 TaxID=1307436 RepID=W7LC22_CYTFI|nr:hypothetical protein PBF_04260 [Cytobacillus firmus DS1]
MHNKTNVLLPAWIWEEAKDKEHLKKLVLQYMQRYPDYTIKGIKNGFAVCERN